MGSSWLVFTFVLIILYQIARVILWEASAMENQEIRKIEDVLFNSNDYASAIEREKELEKTIATIKQDDNLQLEIIDYENDYYLDFQADLQEGLITEDSLLDGYEQPLFDYFISRFILPQSYNLELPLSSTKSVLITVSSEQFKKSEKKLKTALFICLLVTFTLLLIAMFYYTRRTVSRINDINHTCNTIIQGDLSKRVPVLGRNDDYDNLAENINVMLDKIQDLLQGVQQVSDNIAHDLRTPLTHLRNKLEHLNCNESDKHKLMLNADSILSLFNSILSITKLEFKTIDVSKQSIEMGKLLSDLIELYEPIAEEKNITISKALSTCYISANKDLTFQAFSNIIENAIKYSLNDSEISISIEQFSQTNTIITIHDAGEGIPEEEQASVFRRMYRLEKHRGSKGHGLGLTMAKAIFDYHQWQIKLSNTYKGLKIDVHIPHSSPT